MAKRLSVGVGGAQCAPFFFACFHAVPLMDKRLGIAWLHGNSLGKLLVFLGSKIDLSQINRPLWVYPPAR
jgi:hypothetical protein